MIIPHNWIIPDSIKARVGTHTYGRQRAIVEDGHLLLILHRKPDPDQDEREGALFWRTPEGDWKSSLGGKNIRGLKDFLGEYDAAHDQLEKDLEAAQSARDHFNVLEAVTPVKRAATHAFEAIQSARSQLKDYTDIIEVRDLAYDVERRFDILFQDAKNAVDYKIALESEEQADLSKEALRASHRLNLLAALFFPLTALTSVFGMNMSSGLDDGGPILFWLIFAVGVATGFIMKNWVTKPME